MKNWGLQSFRNLSCAASKRLSGIHKHTIDFTRVPEEGSFLGKKNDFYKLKKKIEPTQKWVEETNVTYVTDLNFAFRKLASMETC